MLPSEEQISELQNEFSFWKVFQLRKRWKQLKMSFPSFWYKMQGTAPFWNLNYSQDTALIRIRGTRPPIL